MATSNPPGSQKKKKTLVKIDKDHFFLIKRLFLEGAPDNEYADLLKIPVSSVKTLKKKMQAFEKNLRARRKKHVEFEPQKRGPRKKYKKPPPEIKATYNTKEARLENYQKSLVVRDLILENKSNKDIEEITGIKKNFVARLRLKMFRQKMKMAEKGELEVKEDEVDFKYLNNEMKAKRISKLVEEGHRAIDIGKMLKIDERTVNRWRQLLKEMEKDPDKFKFEEKKELKLKPGADYFPRYRQSIEKSQVETTRKLLECGLNYKDISRTLGMTMSNVMKIKKAILTNTIDEIIDDTAEKIKENVLMKKHGLIDEEEDEKPQVRRKRGVEKIKSSAKRSKVEIKEEFEESDDDWDPSSEWEDELESPLVDSIKIVEFHEEIHEVKKEKEDQKIVKVFDDPLIEPEITITEPPPPPKKVRKKAQSPPKKKYYARDTLGDKPLTDRDAQIAKKLLDNGIRRVDIALMLETTEKAVTKLLDRANGLGGDKIDREIIEAVDYFLKNKDNYKGVQKHYGEIGIVREERRKRKKKRLEKVEKKVEIFKEEILSDDEGETQMDVKRMTAMRLLSVNVKIQDIVKMLSVSEETVKRWKSQADGDHVGKSTAVKSSTSNVGKSKEDSETNLVKEEPMEEEYGDYEVM